MPDSKPLTGLSIVNTRASHQAGPLTAGLTNWGATVLHYPAIRIVPPVDPAPLDNALEQSLRGEYDWLVLTSANTVETISQRLQKMGVEGSGLATSRLRVAAIGPATAETATRMLGVEIALVPDEFVAESLAAALSLQPGTRVFLPQSEIARPFLANAFAQAGADVTQIVAYRTATGQGGDPVPQLFWEGRIDAVTFTSPSAVHNFLKRLKAEGGTGAMLVDVVVACIGPQTAAAAQAHDLPTPIIPAQHTVDGLVAGLCDFFQKE